MELVNFLSRFLSRLILLLIIGNKGPVIGKTSSYPRKLFDYDDYYKPDKLIQYTKQDADRFLTNTPKGLNMALFDLEYPEHNFYSYDLDKNPIYRVIQCNLVGQVNYVQKKVYKNVSFRVKAIKPLYAFSGDSAKCQNKVAVTLSPPGTIGANNTLTNHYKLYQRNFILNKNGTNLVEFENVLNEGFIDMELFWINFEISNKCNQLVTVELLKPYNSDNFGDLKNNQEVKENEPRKGSP